MQCIGFEHVCFAQDDALNQHDSEDEQGGRQVGAAVVVSGPVGSGKSALVHAAAKVCIPFVTIKPLHHCKVCIPFPTINPCTVARFAFHL